jgi:HEPN domain-containing protein
MKRATREWVRKAEADHRAAVRLAQGNEPLHDQTCFHCQQCAEKYLKALLEELSQTVPKTHDLDDLLTLLRPVHPTLRSLRRGLVFLTDFAVDTRYPGNWASKRQAVAALRWAGRVRDVCRAILGIRPPRRRRPSP